MFDLDENSVNQIKQDFTLFFPTINQMKIISDMAEQASSLSSIDCNLLKLIYIRAIVMRQIEHKRFHYELEEMIPQARLKGTLVALENIREIFLDLLQDKDQIDLLMEHHQKVMEYYIEKYVLRKSKETLLGDDVD